jgi:retinol-binding protein 3
MIPIAAVLLASFLHASVIPPAEEHRKIVAEVAAIVETGYAIPELGARMAARLRQQIKAGAYDDLSLESLAQKVDADLRSVANDHHMMLMYSGKSLAPDLGKNASITNPTADPEEAQFTNDGVTKIERLPGNVGYLKLEYFYPPDQATDTLSAAMNAISATDALIIDLRENIGGHPGTVAFLCSYFFEHRTHLNDIVDQRNQRTTSFWTDPNVPGKRYLGRPVYVLVSSTSFSAAEEFAYNLQVFGRATIVGATTAGAANPNIPVRLNDHLVFYVPTGRAVNPITRSNWEGIGVKPNIAVDPLQALQRAQVLALQTLLANSPNHARTEERKAALQQIRNQQ